MEKIKKNLNFIVVILSIAGLFFTVYSLAPSLLQNMNETIILYIISYVLYLLAFGWLIVGCSKEVTIKSIKVPFLLLIGANLVPVFDMFNNNTTYENILYLVLYVAIIVLLLLVQKNKKLLFPFIACYSIYLISLVAGVFSGFRLSIILLLLNVIFIYKVYTKEEEEE